MEKFSQMSCVLYLCGLSVLDIRRRRLPVYLLVAGVGMAVVYQVFFGKDSWLFSLVGAAVGVLFLGVSKWTEEAFGYGDSILILTLGIYLGVWQQFYLLLIAFLLAAGFSVGALTCRHFKRKTVFPFVPFLGAAYLGMLLMGIL